MGFYIGKRSLTQGWLNFRKILIFTELRLRNPAPGVNFTNILRTTFMPRSQKCKKTDGLTVYFALLWSAQMKAARKMLRNPASGELIMMKCIFLSRERGWWYVNAENNKKKALTINWDIFINVPISVDLEPDG